MYEETGGFCQKNKGLKGTMMKKLWSVLLACVLLFAAASVAVADSTGKIVIEMTDSENDGWNGAGIRVFEDGELLGTAALVEDNLSSGTWACNYDSTSSYTFRWVQGTNEGAYDIECEFFIFIDEQEVLNANGAGYVPNQLIYPEADIEEDYGISVDNALQNGTIEVDDKLTIASPGDTLSVTATPEEGYYLTKISVMDADADEDEAPIYQEDVASVEAYRYDFLMPAMNVTITAAFEKLSAYRIRTGVNGEGMIDSPITANADEPIEFDAYPYGEYKLGSLKITATIDGQETEISYTESTEYENKYSFTMPAGDVKIVAEFVRDGSGEGGAAGEDGEVGGDEDAVWYYVGGEIEGEGKLHFDRGYYRPEGAEIRFKCVPNPGYELTSISVSAPNDEPVTLKRNGLNEYSFIMPASDVAVYARFEPAIIVYFDNVKPNWEIIVPLVKLRSGGERRGHVVEASDNFPVNSIVTVALPADAVEVLFKNTLTGDDRDGLHTEYERVEDGRVYTYDPKSGGVSAGGSSADDAPFADAEAADDLPKTGDDSNLLLWFALMGMSLVGAAAMIAAKRREN